MVRMLRSLALVLLVTGAAPPSPTLVLTRDGFRVGTTRAIFDRTPRAAAIALASRALGKPRATGSHGDCGQGKVIGYAKFAGDFELSFVGGRLSGWTEDGKALATDRGLGVGATVATLKRLYTDVYVDPGDEANGGLGPSFQNDPGPSGWLDGTRLGAHVSGMFSGATCLAGI